MNSNKRPASNGFIITTITVLISITIVTSCDYRTPSRKRFSKTCDILIPENVVVINDEYQDMWQDYAIVYEIELSDQTCAELTESIRNSAYYNPDVFITDYVEQSMFIDTFGMKAVWARTGSGYYFGNELGRDVYSVEVDTIKLTAKFDEGHD